MSDIRRPRIIGAHSARRIVALAVVAALAVPAPVSASYAAHVLSNCMSNTAVRVCIWVDYNVKTSGYPSASGFAAVDAEQYVASVTRLDSTIALTGLQIQAGVNGYVCSPGGYDYDVRYTGWVQGPRSGTQYVQPSWWAGDYVMLNTSVSFQQARANVTYSRGTSKYSASVLLKMPTDYDQTDGLCQP